MEQEPVAIGQDLFCPECGMNVTDKPAVCPGCGDGLRYVSIPPPFPEDRTKNEDIWSLVTVGTIFAVIIIGVLAFIYIPGADTVCCSAILILGVFAWMVLQAMPGGSRRGGTSGGGGGNTGNRDVNERRRIERRRGH